MVVSAYCMPARSATRTTAGSPSCCIIRVKPVGANENGSAARAPRIVVEVSTSPTSRRTDGLKVSPANVSRARPWLISPSAAPSV